MADAAKLLHEARASVRTVRESLLDPSPAALTQSWPHLQSAIDALRRLQPVLADRSQPTDALRSAAAALHRDVRLLAALLDSAVRFASGWSGCLSARIAGYTPGGVSALPTGARRQVSIEG